MLGLGLGLGLGTRDQRRPFQCSISVRSASLLRVRYAPTAQASLAETALTEIRTC